MKNVGAFVYLFVCVCVCVCVCVYECAYVVPTSSSKFNTNWPK